MNHYFIERHGRSLVLILSCCLAVLILIAVMMHINDTPNGSLPAAPTAPSIVKNPNSIAIPGYEMLELQSDTKVQNMCLPNPPQNDCYFQIRLYLEDGTLLWESNLIEPGKTSDTIVLTTVLTKGIYPNALLHYSCFRMDEALSPLNGAQMKVTLWVK